KYVRKMIVIFPFEQEFYGRHGVEVSYVGHPLAYAPPPQISREEFAAKHSLDPKKQWIALLPGSRKKEVHLNLPAMVEAAELLKQRSEFEFILPVASTLNQDWLREQLALCTAGWSRPSGLRSEPLKNPASATEVADHKQQAKASTHEGPLVHLTDNARATLMHARAAVVASGTATVEAALSGTPFIVVYRLALLTWLLGRRLVKLDTFAMPDLIAGEKIVPELIQNDFTAENVARELNAIIPDGPARQQMESGL